MANSFCDPVDCSLPGSPVHESSQARTLEWVAFPTAGALPDPGIEPLAPALASRETVTREAQYINLVY